MVEIRADGLPHMPAIAHQPRIYEHHIEPRLETFGFADTDWLKYLNGFQTTAQ